MIAATGCGPDDFGPILSVIQEDFPGDGEFTAWKVRTTLAEFRERAVVAWPILRKRRVEEAADAERRAAIHAEHMRNRQERIDRVAAGGHHRRNR